MRYRHDDLLRDYKYALGEKYVTAGGVKFCYQDQGEGEHLLIIPGLCTSADFWQQTIPVLSKRYHVWAIDPPGCGKSAKPDVPYDLPWLRDRIVDFMDCMHIQRAHLMGGSLGGHLAMMIALEHPERVNKLILMGSSGAWPRPSPPVTLALATLWNDHLVTDHLRRNWPDIYNKMFVHQTPLTKQIFEQQMAARANVGVYFPEGRAATRVLRSIFFNSVLDRLPQITQPTLLVWGESDNWHLRNEAKALRSGLPHARLVFVPDSGHEVMLDQPEVFNRLVLTFLAQGIDAIDEPPLPNGHHQASSTTSPS
jgi:pimeloyl-ACP methyl ester carboxylesterase